MKLCVFYTANNEKLTLISAELIHTRLKKNVIIVTAKKKCLCITHLDSRVII